MATKSKNNIWTKKSFSRHKLAIYVIAFAAIGAVASYFLYAAPVATVPFPNYPIPPISKTTEKSDYYGIAIPGDLFPNLQGSEGDNKANELRTKLSATGAGWIRTDVSQGLHSAFFNNSQCAMPNSGCSSSTNKLGNYSVLASIDHITMRSAPLYCPSLGYAPSSVNVNFTFTQWKQVVDCVSKTFKGKVKAYEIWNEPVYKDFQTGYQNGSAENYYSMLKNAYQIIKRNDSQATVVGLGGLLVYSGGDNTRLNKDKEFAKQLSSMGAGHYMDAISLHPYPWGQPTNALLDAYVSNWDYYKSLFPGKTVWVTETGQNIDHGNQETYMYKAYGLSINQGAGKLFWYLYQDKIGAYDGVGFGLYDSNGQARPAVGYMKSYISTPKSGLLRAYTNPAAGLKFSIKPVLPSSSAPLVKDWGIDWERLQEGSYTVSFSYPSTTFNGQVVKLPKQTTITIKAGMTLELAVDITKGTATTKYFWE